jgi:hypothetical protein
MTPAPGDHTIAAASQQQPFRPIPGAPATQGMRRSGTADAGADADGRDPTPRMARVSQRTLTGRLADGNDDQFHGTEAPQRLRKVVSEVGLRTFGPNLPCG